MSLVFESTAIDGVRHIRLAPMVDARGSFARTWCRETFAAHGGQGLDAAMVQASTSFNVRAGTLRGMHFAWPPATECKLVRCTRGRVFDQLIDLRPESPTYRATVSVTLDAALGNALWIPRGVAHGFQTLVDDSEVFYMMTEAYRSDLSAGWRADDPAFGLTWPLPVSAMSDRDRDGPDFDDAAHRQRYAAGLAAHGTP
ncbi:dTDP-4-dehydrorhamnose 3,5-epimerase family protein [Sphaerotilus sp.]|uniref:dTDP-4-dehydrorhamnose 3,5-epimerase family protein n=1 Tax=Sphaerotilus sp. TaxID=2093942 RepID=UPI002ACDBD22|nr:dTDP-4-dehydrorhamnose 3,5-epimerase family protein [Sphaerotilus sp.]MDZ7857519.1 dTDP-4-dehydrorhamnose 3,5-epimerase family protein [Sphaerotilus sp.]